MDSSWHTLHSKVEMELVHFLFSHAVNNILLDFMNIKLCYQIGSLLITFVLIEFHFFTFFFKRERNCANISWKKGAFFFLLAMYGHLKKLWFKSGYDCGFGCSSGHLRRSISYNSPLLYESERKKGEDGNYVNVNASTTFFGFLFLGSKREDLQWSPLLHYCSHFTMVALCLFGTTIKHACQAR